MKRNRGFLVRGIIGLLLGSLFLADTVSLAEAPILPDASAPGNRQPLVLETANGIPLVNIAAPSSSGVSRNDYARFNVSEKGAVLNNSYTLSQTELAGYVQGNANMAKGPAQIIVNQVTSGNPTAMNGFIEVAGNKADVIIANPNGITVNGGGFLNTSRAILTTGKPEYDTAERLKDFRVDNDSRILVTGNGLNGKKADSLEIYTRAAEIQAAIWGNQIHIINGSNVIDAATREAKAIDGNGNRPEIAIDVKDAGGMYGGYIYLIANEKGLPANIAGVVESQNLVLDSQGNLFHSGTTHSRGSVDIHAPNIENTGTIVSSDAMVIRVDDSIINQKVIGSEGNLVITAGELKNHKTIASEKDLEINLSSEKENALDNQNSEILANGDITIQTAHSYNVNGIMASGGNFVSQGNSLDNTSGSVTAYGDVTISASDQVENENGSIEAHQDTFISSDAIKNNRGVINAGRDETITTQNIQLDGKLAAGRNLSIETIADITNEKAEENYGITQAGGSLTISTQGDITNSKKLEAKKKITLNAKDLGNKESGEINGGNISITGNGVSNHGLISADETNEITAEHVQNIATGRIYGEDISIHAKNLENRKDKEMEEKLSMAVSDLKQKEKELDDAFATDVTAFSSDAEKAAYFQNIKEKQKAYEISKSEVDMVLAEMGTVKSGSIAARNDLTITGDTLLNSASALLYAGGDMTISEEKSITNRGADIKALGNVALNAPIITNENEAFSAKRVWTGEETNPTLIRIDQEGHPERGKSFLESEFSELTSGYGAYHNKGIAPKELYEEAGYAKIEQITEEEREEGETPIANELIGKEAPNYDYDDPIFDTLGVTSMPTARPDYDDPTQADWDTQYKEILKELNEKIIAYNEEAKVYNASIGAIEGSAIKNYTIIRSTIYTSAKEVQETKAATISSGKDMTLTGNITNENSRIMAGDALSAVGGTLDNIAEKNQVQKVTFGTTQESYTAKRHWPHKSWRRHYRDQVFMTPQVERDNPTSLGVGSYSDKTQQKPKAEDITQTMRENVQQNLNPFAADTETAPGTVAGKETGGEMSFIPDSSLYQLHPEETAKYLVETDSSFTNKKKFLSSDYMYDQMLWDNDKVTKRLGDGFYEQELIRNQVTQLTGMRYLDGYSNDEEEFQALMDAGIAYAKEYNLKPGIALTKEQMASLTSDMVWLEATTVAVDGKTYEVLYPHVYLKAGTVKTLAEDGSIISGNTLIAETEKLLLNHGTLKGNTIIAKAGNIVNDGTIYGANVELKAKQDIIQDGMISGDEKVNLFAGRDISMQDTVIRQKNQDILNNTAGIAVKGNDGVLLMEAGRDIHLTGATLEALGDQGSMILSAGRNLNMDTDDLAAKKDMTENSDNYIRTYRKTETTNTLAAGKNISLTAGENWRAKNTSLISENGEITIAAKGDVTIENGYTEATDDYGLKYKESGFFSHKTTTIKSHDESKLATSSAISGDTVAISSEGNTKVVGSNIVATHGISITSGKDTIITSAEEQEQHDYEKRVKKSGFLGGGLGFTIGVEKRKDQYADADMIQHGSMVGSINGNVSIVSGKDIRVEASNLVAEKDISVSGENVTISSKDNVYYNDEKHEYKKSGLSVSLSGGAAGVVMDAVNYAQKASNARDKRLKALYGGEIYETIAKNKEVLKQSDGKGMPGINVGIGSSSYTEEGHTETVEAVGSQLYANKDIRITAHKDILMAGSSAIGEDVSVKAGGNILLDATENTSSSRMKESGKAGQVGMSFMPSGNSFYANVSKGRGNETEEIVTHTASQVVARKNMLTESGEDTVLRGSHAYGDKVTMSVGGNLNIESLQDKDNYTSHTESRGAGVTIGTSAKSAGQGGLSAGMTKSDTDSIYESVAEQAGITAGSHGYNISVNENTHLLGGIIDSEATAGKNTLTTGTLTWEDIENKAGYKATSTGENYSVTWTPKEIVNGKRIGGFTGGISLTKSQPVKGKAETATRSAISKGTINVKDQGHQKQSIVELKRNTKNTLNQLEQIFDKERSEERQALVNEFAKLGAEKIGDIAKENGWAKDDARRMALHSFLGGLTAKLGGNNILSGAMAAGTAEGLQPLMDEFLKNYPEMREEATSILGYVTGKLFGGDGEVGAATAWNATKFNWLSHEQQEERENLIEEAEGRGDEEAAQAIRSYYDQLDQEQDGFISFSDLPETDSYSKELEKGIVNGTGVLRDLREMDNGDIVVVEALRLAKRQGLTNYAFSDEDFVLLSGSIGNKLGVSGGFIMDRRGNVYYTAGVGMIFGASAGIVSGKFKTDTSAWENDDYINAISGLSGSFGYSGGFSSASIAIGTQYGDREIGGNSGLGISGTGTLNYTQFICNINKL